MLDKVYDYWFNKFNNPLKWLYAGKKYDQEIIDTFQKIHLECYQKKYDNFKTAKNILVRIIILDQLSRHIYRNNKKQYHYDNIARNLTLNNLHLLSELDFYETIYFLMPLNHSENISDKDILIEYYKKLITRFIERKDKINKFINIINKKKISTRRI